MGIRQKKMVIARNNLQNGWIKNNPKLNKEKVISLARAVYRFMIHNYKLKYVEHLYNLDLCIDCEDEKGANGFWDATHSLIQEKYKIDFTYDNDKAWQEQQDLYYVFSAMRGFYFGDIMKEKYLEETE